MLWLSRWHSSIIAVRTLPYMLINWRIDKPRIRHAAATASAAASLRLLAIALLSRALAAAQRRRAALLLLPLLRCRRLFAALPVQVPGQPCRPGHQVGQPLLPRDLLCLLKRRLLLGGGDRGGGRRRRLSQVGRWQAGGPLLLRRCCAAWRCRVGAL